MPRAVSKAHESHKITDFFCETKNNCDAEKIENVVEKNLTHQFYKNCVDEQSKPKCTEECMLKKSTLKQKILDAREKLKTVEAAYETVMKVIQMKGEKIDALQKDLELCPKPESINQPGNVLFEEFKVV